MFALRSDLRLERVRRHFEIFFDELQGIVDGDEVGGKQAAALHVDVAAESAFDAKASEDIS